MLHFAPVRAEAETSTADEAPSAAPAPRTGVPVPPSRRLRKAYWVTFLVAASYLRFRLTARFRSEAGASEAILRLHLRNARRINRAIHDLQGLYIKVGQLLSILTNVLPEAFRRELEGLQDRIPPRAYRDIEARLREDLGGRAPREVFAEFDETPVASASIAQVHRARLRTGEAVAVKVQYPDIEEIAQVDLRALRRIFRVISWFLPYAGLDAVYAEIRAMVLKELDFRAEAVGLERVAANFASRADVGFPKVFHDYSSSHVLVTEWIDGIKVGDIARLDAAGVDRRVIARRAVEAYCKQIFTDGVYHADPHPGNLLVQPQSASRIVFLDFGAVAEVSPAMRQGLVEVIQGALSRDTNRVANALRTMGFATRTADPRVFERVVDYFHERFQEEIQLDSLNLRDVKFDPKRGLEKLADLRHMNISLRDITESFYVPKEWILLERTLLLLMGLCTALDPQMNPTEVIRPYLEEFVLGKDRDASRLVLQTTKDVALSALAIPGDLKKFLGRAMRGEIEVRFLGVEESARVVQSAARELVYAIVGVASVAFWLALSSRGEARLARIAIGVAGACAVMLAWSMLGARTKRGRRR